MMRGERLLFGGPQAFWATVDNLSKAEKLNFFLDNIFFIDYIARTLERYKTFMDLG
jgi:hypothetical protein